MPSKLQITTIRLKEPTNTKIREIAILENRKLNDQITMILEKYISDYENEHGTINIKTVNMGDNHGTINM